MASKRSREDEPVDAQIKKARTGFKVGPDNLPDGTWRRKVVKIKKDLIHKAKVKKSYAKIKAREAPSDRPVLDVQQPQSPAVEVSQELHPERQAMLDGPRQPSPPGTQPEQQRSRDRRRSQRPAYFEKELAYAEKAKNEAEARRQESERRDRERLKKTEERERFRRAMAKARTGGRNGQRKLGRESQVLLEKVKRLVGDTT